jgi:RHS repeat-associated protein
MSVPIPTSPGRSGFGPQLSLSYDSGSGNGPFGFGWSLSLPSITRKTDKGLPKYDDAHDTDVFLLSGAEDLVPVLVERNGQWERQEQPRSLYGTLWTVRRYRPRLEGLFARIERWTHTETGETHWRSISKDNITTLYGKTKESRIGDPDDPARVFSWLICESHDDKGNAVVYEYASEDEENVDRRQANERNRVRTANRYLKRIKYGNRVSRLVQPDLTRAEWLFEVVFDHDEGHCEELPLEPDRVEAEQHRFVLASVSPGRPWPVRPDPFSAYRAGFEVRTYRRCHRILMFHRFDELGDEPYLVRSTEFEYADLDDAQGPDIETELAHQGSTRFASFIRAVTQSGYVRDESRPVVERDGVRYRTYLKKSLPPLEFQYSKAVIQEDVRELDAESLENLPSGLDGGSSQWVDLDGEGVSGILTEQADAWFYKPNLGGGRFGPLGPVARKPSLAALGQGRQQLLDLAGDGQLDLVEFTGPMPGFYERTDQEDWENFRPFGSLPNIAWDDPNLRLVDLTGDGHADILITEDQALIWYPSLAEAGFGAAERVQQALDEEEGPRLVLADGTQSVYLADLSGDGLTDLVRIRNGEVCYWPNLGYGRFGPKVTMDNAPWFDAPDQFDPRRSRLADIDGSGTTDIIYLGRDGVRLYFNQSGNRWSEARPLASFPAIDNLASVAAVDLLGNGTACLVWSSPLPSAARRPLRYIDLMGHKPHLLVKVTNHLGAETRVGYAPSTRCYLADKAAGKPWITRLPFPVHVVERVETYDRISRNRFVTRYAYHHGYFDGEEREFRGFGMVEQWDTEQFAALTERGAFPTGDNIDEASHVPPVYTRTWSHTGIHLGRDRVSNFFAGLLDAENRGEYYREPGLTDAQARARLLPDTVLPDGLTPEEEREACRALKGLMLRQEVYALDGTQKEAHPYMVTEQNSTIRVLQPRGSNRHAVFFTHPREAITYHYERNAADPRVQHALTLEVDDFSNVLKEVAIGYGRRQPDTELPLDADRAKQTRTIITYTENRITKAIEEAEAYRTPLPCETRTYELTGYTPTGPAGRFRPADFVEPDATDPRRLTHRFDSEISYEAQPTADRQRRLIEQVRTLYRKNDLTGLLPLGALESRALPGETYRLAFAPGLLDQVFRRNGQPLLPNPAGVLGSTGTDQGGYVNLDSDGRWWIPAGRVFLSPDRSHTPAQELAYARGHFFLPHCYQDPFGQPTTLTYDAYDLLLLETRDPVGNRVTAGERGTTGNLVKPANNYRVLQPRLVMDANYNRAAVTFDALGLVVGTALMGKPEEHLGDSLAGFETDLTEAEILAHLANPLADPHALLGRATTRLVYDLFAYARTKEQASPQPAVSYTLVRETHDADLQPDEWTKIQHSFSYSDGFGREIQKKIQAEPGPVPQRDADGQILMGADGQPAMTADGTSPRWVGSGWTVYNNKGKPVRQYEPFFSDTHRPDFEARIGAAKTLFYDPVERVVAVLHPNDTYEKVVFDPWRQVSYDVNDTVAAHREQTGDPRTDKDIRGFVKAYFAQQGTNWQTWLAQRQGGGLGAAEQAAATRAAAHANTPTTTYLDTLGRTFLTRAHNGYDAADDPIYFDTRGELDIEGNQRAVIDAAGRMVMTYDYDMLGNRTHQSSMEAGQRWTLNDVTGKPIRAWDSRGHSLRTEYDALRRPERRFVQGFDAAESDPDTLAGPVLYQRTEYGEGQPNAADRNLRTRVYRQLDGAGIVTSDYNFKGNLVATTREVAATYNVAIDWAVAQPAGEQFVSSTRYDALNRPIQIITPHQQGAHRNVIQPVYNEGNLLERLDVWLGRPSDPPALIDGAVEAPSIAGVADIDYNAKGQRTRIDYRNGVTTRYAYDEDTFRLTHLYTKRGAAFSEDCGAEPPPPRFAAPDTPPATTPCGLQNLHYTYDPAGNITHIRDDAQQRIFFRNQRVDATSDYTYDAVYRLIQATGREHLGQASGTPIPHSYNDAPRIGLLHPGDGNAVGRYCETYEYDRVGNIQVMKHHQSCPGAVSWSRTHVYNETSLLEDGTGGTALQRSNRLTGTTVAGSTETYSNAGDGYDAHGNMQRMPQLQVMQWDFQDQLQMTRRQVVNADDAEGGPRQGERTYYRYDAAGQRVRKVTETAAGQLKDERIYLGGLEIYHRHWGASTGLARETLHITDDQQLIALAETRNHVDDGTPVQVIRYQLGNHLGSASLEVDEQARIVSYEEHTPYGSTSYQAVRSLTEVPKRYRYTGKERDEESGLYYHGARYYAPWLGRWTRCDPMGLRDGISLYTYGSSNPINFRDPDGMQSQPPRQGLPGVGVPVREAIARAELNVALANLDKTLRAHGSESPEYREAYKQLARFQRIVVNEEAWTAKNLNFGYVLAEAIGGDFYEGESRLGYWSIALHTGIGLVPGVGQLADGRDTVAALKKVSVDPRAFAAWGGLAIAAVAWVPGMDWIKGGKRALKELWTEAAKKSMSKGGGQVLREHTRAGVPFMIEASKEAFEVARGAGLYVYELRNAAGDIIYVGQSSDAVERLLKHLGDKEWFGEIAEMSLLRGGLSHKEATALEQLIKTTRTEQGHRLYQTAEPHEVAYPGELLGVDLPRDTSWPQILFKVIQGSLTKSP